MKYALALSFIFTNITLSFAQSTFDLRFPMNIWHACGAPREVIDPFGNTLFPEADYNDTLITNFNKAKLAWYNIDPLFLQNMSATPAHILNDPAQRGNHYVREIDEQEINGINQPVPTTILTFDLAFYPQERGSYNYESTPNGTAFSQGLHTTGQLKEPESRWGGVMRTLNNTDFEAAGVNVLSFWLLDPFIYDSNSTGGELYINFGNISEDYTRDSRRFAENFLQCSDTITTAWGVTPGPNIPSGNQFSSDPVERACQDVGFDGLNDTEESSFFSDYLDQLSTFLDSSALSSANDDPSGDNYHYYLGSDYDTMALSILERYKRYNEPQVNASPDFEDLNADLTLQESESYFQYRIPLQPDMPMGQNFITNKRVVYPSNQNLFDPPAVWYEFRIPLAAHDVTSSQPPDFKSIRFMRMFLTGFEDEVVLRFARLQLESTTSVSVQNIGSSFRIYPNPNEGKFVMEGSDNIRDITVFDVLGKRIEPQRLQLSEDSRSAQVELGAHGLYFIRIETEKGISTHKVLSR